jgi:hypothetical protein
VKPSTSFVICRTGNDVAEFALQEQCGFHYGRIESVRSCLREHLAALRERVDALSAILATGDPERAERLLMDPVNVLVTEVTLRPRSEAVAFEEIMKRLSCDSGTVGTD